MNLNILMYNSLAFSQKDRILYIVPPPLLLNVRNVHRKLPWVRTSFFFLYFAVSSVERDDRFARAEMRMPGGIRDSVE